MRLPLRQLWGTNNRCVLRIDGEYNAELAMLSHIRCNPCGINPFVVRPKKIHRQKAWLPPKRPVGVLAPQLSDKYLDSDCRRSARVFDPEPKVVRWDDIRIELNLGLVAIRRLWSNSNLKPLAPPPHEDALAEQSDQHGQPGDHGARDRNPL